jgi:hypothetical protein
VKIRTDTYLYADGSDDANLVPITCVHILRDIIIFRVPRIILGLAACRYDRLGGQVDDVHMASVQKYVV